MKLPDISRVFSRIDRAQDLAYDKGILTIFLVVLLVIGTVLFAKHPLVVILLLLGVVGIYIFMRDR
jgi:uncharacterized membrane protein